MSAYPRRSWVKVAQSLPAGLDSKQGVGGEWAKQLGGVVFSPKAKVSVRTEGTERTGCVCRGRAGSRVVSTTVVFTVGVCWEWGPGQLSTGTKITSLHGCRNSGRDKVIFLLSFKCVSLLSLSFLHRTHLFFSCLCKNMQSAEAETTCFLFYFREGVSWHWAQGLHPAALSAPSLHFLPLCF